MLKARVERTAKREKTLYRGSDAAISLRHHVTIDPKAQRLTVIIACNMDPFTNRQGIIPRYSQATEPDLWLSPPVEAKQKAIRRKIDDRSRITRRRSESKPCAR